MSTKVRNKSAALQQNDHNSQQQSLLLKIESVVPKLSSRTLKINKLTRSHSTLTSSLIRKINESNRTFVVRGGTYQPQDASGDATIQVAPNGLYTIKRTLRDREKLPDRINLDRKGLTMIPLIEDEPNLRLLSLQHNLINIFHIPSESPPESKALEQIAESSPPQKEVLLPPRLTRQLSRQRSVTSSGRGGVAHGGQACTWGCNNNCTKGQNRPPPHQTFLQQKQPLLLNAQPKHILRKSNSFIQNYPNLYTSPPSQISNSVKSQFTTSTNNMSVTARNKLIHTPSFSVDNLSNENTQPNSKQSGNSASNLIPTTAFEESTVESPRIEVKHNLGNLVFLDLYDNQIETITNLEGLRSLTVLLLGKNRITDISGLAAVKHTLRVLDLHGNKIANISQRISPLQELKSLNLAGNLLKQIQDKDFSSLYNLKELNLKRNKIRKIVGFDDLRSLERLWLCHNELQRVEDMCTIARAINLKEVTIENNAVSLAGDCASFLVSYLPNLTSLSQMQITEQVRRAAAAWRKNKEASDASYLNLTTDVCMNMRREEIISNARTNWELLRGQPPNQRRAQVDKLDFFNGRGRQLRSALPVKSAKKGKRVIKPSSRDNSVTSEQGGEDYFRLPPILAPFLDQQKDFTNSTSSLGPNVDSGSSIYSSDNDENKAKVVVETPNEEKAPPEVEEPVKETVIFEAPSMDTLQVSSPGSSSSQKLVSEELKEPVSVSIQELSLPLEDVSQVDKQSNISSASIKSSESVVSSERAEKCKSAAPKRQSTVTNARAQTAKSASNNVPAVPKTSQSKGDRDREQGGDYLIEICGRYLNVYGYGALKFIDKQWNLQKASDVHTIKFSYINYNNITTVLSRIKSRFPNAENYVFRETNIYCLGQMNALAETQGLVALTIDAEGNPITEKKWRSYAVYRLSHWGLKCVNGEEVTEDEIQTAEAMYSGLSDLVLWSLPEVLLQPLLTRLRLEETCQASKMTAKEWLMQAEASLKSVVGKEALQWKKNSGQFAEESAVRDKGKKHFVFMMENTCNAVEKLQRLETMWSTVLLEMVRNTLIDYSQIEAYVKGLMQELSK